jgi:polysaccharide biosynthesis/export protein
MRLEIRHSIRITVLLLVCSGFVSGRLAGQSAPGADAGHGTRNSEIAQTVAHPDQLAIRQPHDDTFVIGADDVLAISVWKEPDLTRSIPVRTDGMISLPLMGEVRAAGRTPLQLEVEISNRLRNYITVPEVTVMVEKINSKKFNILGMVANPGAYPLGQPTTIVDAIAAAGGFKDFAKTKSIYILRVSTDGTQARIPFNYKDFIKGKNAAQNIKIEPRDTIIVP